jgi:hypothetical protein
MAKFYGQVSSNSSQTNATRQGTEYIKTSAQSYDGSIQTKLWYSDGKLMVELSFCGNSGADGDRLFIGEFRHLVEKFGGKIDG